MSSGSWTLNAILMKDFPWLLSKSGKRAYNHISIIYDITLRYKNESMNWMAQTAHFSFPTRDISPWEAAPNAIYSFCLDHLIKQKWKIYPENQSLEYCNFITVSEQIYLTSL